MWGSLNTMKTVKWRAFIKNLHYFTVKFARPIEKHSKVVVYCVHKANGGMADEKAVVLCVQYGTIIL